MKKLFIIFVLISIFSLNGYSLVLVHIGDQLPPYITDCIQQARLFNPDCAMYLIANESAIEPHKDFFKKYSIHLATIEKVHKSPRHAEFLERTRYMPGFWRYASERFLYIDDFMEEYNVTDLFHIENDVMLYADLSELLPIVQRNYQGIAGVFDSDDRCIPSFIFLPNKQLMAQLAQYFVDQTGKQKNDMEIIAMFRNRAHANIIDRLPIIMEPYIAACGLKNDLGHTPKQPLKYAEHVNEFNSIFDAAAIGQYLGGTFFADKGPGFINETCVFNPSKLKYEWLIDAQGRKIPYAIFEDRQYRINNLHIHSKRLYEFRSN